MDKNQQFRHDWRNSELGRRIMRGLEQVANDESETPRKRREAARKLAEWKSA